MGVLESMVHNSGAIETGQPILSKRGNGKGHYTSLNSLHSKLDVTENLSASRATLAKYDKNVISAAVLEQPLMAINSVIRCPQIIPEHPSVGLSPRRTLDNTSENNWVEMQSPVIQRNIKAIEVDLMDPTTPNHL
jgi:hypothetical protein